MAADRFSYKSLAWTLFAALALHNLEEGLAVKAMAPEIARLLAQHLPALAAVWRPEAFYRSLAAATLLPLAGVVYATTGRPSAGKEALLAVLAAVLLLNVFVPHVPAAVVLGGYAPGVATAVLLNLPVSALFLRRAVREGRVSRRAVAVCLGLALLVLALAVPLLLYLGYRA
jgi:hypothetical protein